LAAEKIAGGDLRVSIAKTNGRHDEVGMMMHSFGNMSQSLDNMARIAERIAIGDLAVTVRPQSGKDQLGTSFAAMVENLRKAIQEIRDGIAVLAASSSEILAASTQLAAGAAETATAVSQTTTTVEEVKQTAHVSSQKAKHVSETAMKSAQVAQAGKKSVDDCIEAMRRIQQQVDVIADSIVKLSEQGQSIGEIVATVNDLAEQSNLLAVNAAIEAAKAGEYGRGFSVVAQEIKSLADQSRHATAQVRSLLTDIQKATGAAVLATEQGSKAVQGGVVQSTKAGEAIQILNEHIGQAAQAATQIAASSQQQLVGMDQVAIAMDNIRKASSENVASTKQTETSAHGLHDVGQKLKAVVERYRV
jgi:methyl-accepting chemotaxis protein